MAQIDILMIVAAGVLLATAALIDLRTRRIPDWLTLPAIIIGAIILSGRCLYGYSVWSAMLTSAASLSLPYLLWVTGSWGGGDARACIGAFLLAGPAFPALSIIAAFSGCLALLLIVRQIFLRIGPKRVRTDEIMGRPLGPSILAAYIFSAGVCFALFGGTA